MKTKALISFEDTAKLICVFVFAYADCLFSHEAAHLFPHFVNGVNNGGPHGRLACILLLNV